MGYFNNFYGNFPSAKIIKSSGPFSEDYFRLEMLNWRLAEVDY